MGSLSQRLVRVLRLIGERHRKRLAAADFGEDGRPSWDKNWFVQETLVGYAEEESLRRRLNELLAALTRERASTDLLELIVKRLEYIQGGEGRLSFWDELESAPPEAELRGREAVTRALEGRIAEMVAVGELLFEADPAVKNGPGENESRGDDLGRLTREVGAIVFVQEQLKTTGKLPTKTAIAKALEVDRRTLNNWSAFKVAYKKLKSETRRQPAKGTKAKDGTLEAWRESGK